MAAEGAQAVWQVGSMTQCWIVHGPETGPPKVEKQSLAPETAAPPPIVTTTLVGALGGNGILMGLGVIVTLLDAEKLRLAVVIAGEIRYSERVVEGATRIASDASLLISESTVADTERSTALMHWLRSYSV